MTKNIMLKTLRCHRHGPTEYLRLEAPAVDVCVACVKQGFFHPVVARPAKKMLKEIDSRGPTLTLVGLNADKSYDH